MTIETEWDSEKLLTKATVYAGYARGVERSSPLYGFWSTLYLELLARSALSKVHPVLLADPQDGKNILYVFGVPILKGEPISIPAKSVYSRCLGLLDDYDERASIHCLAMAKSRNTEVHSGDSGFEQLTHNRWQPEHYRVVKILCEFLGADISDFFDPKEAAAIEEVLEASTKQLEGVARGKVKTNKNWFKCLPQTEQESLSEGSVGEAQGLVGKHGYTSEQKCVACSSPGLLFGGRELDRKVQLVDGDLTETVTMVSSRFVCGACRLDLNRDELIALELPPTFSEDRSVGPVEYFGVNPLDYLDIDELRYGND